MMITCDSPHTTPLAMAEPRGFLFVFDVRLRYSCETSGHRHQLGNSRSTATTEAVVCNSSAQWSQDQGMDTITNHALTVSSSDTSSERTYRIDGWLTTRHMTAINMSETEIGAVMNSKNDLLTL